MSDNKHSVNNLGSVTSGSTTVAEARYNSNMDYVCFDFVHYQALKQYSIHQLVCGNFLEKCRQYGHGVMKLNQHLPSGTYCMLKGICDPTIYHGLLANSHLSLIEEEASQAEQAASKQESFKLH